MEQFVVAHRHADDIAAASLWSVSVNGSDVEVVANSSQMPTGWLKEAEEHIDALHQTLQQLQREQSGSAAAPAE